MVTRITNRTYRRHLDCGGDLVYSELWPGGYGYICQRCGQVLFKKGSKKGGRQMPFPKEARDAGEVLKEKRGQPIEGFIDVPLLLKRYETFDTGQFGQGVVLYCESEDGEEVKISTFSEPVRNQVNQLVDNLPLIITPRWNGTYYTIA